MLCYKYHLLFCDVEKGEVMLSFLILCVERGRGMYSFPGFLIRVDTKQVRVSVFYFKFTRNVYKNYVPPTR